MLLSPKVSNFRKDHRSRFFLKNISRTWLANCNQKTQFILKFTTIHYFFSSLYTFHEHVYWIFSHSAPWRAFFLLDPWVQDVKFLVWILEWSALHTLHRQNLPCYRVHGGTNHWTSPVVSLIFIPLWVHLAILHRCSFE